MSKRVIRDGLRAVERTAAMWRISVSASAFALACAVSVPAHATLLDFELTGSRDASFELPSTPTPNNFSSSAFGAQVQFLDVAGTFGGVGGTATIGFGTGIIADLDISGTPLGFTQFAGPDIFSGSAETPTFAPGVFELTSIVSGDSTLTISLAPSEAASGTVPEPASWVMLLTGLGFAGLRLRCRPAGPNAVAA